MKITLIATIFACVSASLAAPQQPNLEDISRIPNGETYALECLLSSGLKLDSLKSLQTGDFSVNGDKVKCLVRCFFEKTGFMDADGNLQREAIVQQLSQMMPRDQVDNLLQSCDVQGADPCDTAYRATDCYFKNKAGLF